MPYLKKITAVFTGGGTLGSVSPLLAVFQELKEQTDLTTAFIGTTQGPEKSFISQYQNLNFYTVPSGKLRRYFSLKNFIDPVFIIAGFFKAWLILKKLKPDFVMSAGSFVSVPVGLAAKMLKIKLFIYQLDIKPTLSNKILARLADKVFVTFEKSLADFNNKNKQVVGAVLRKEIEAIPSIQSNQKTILVLGGGTGALSLNKLVTELIKKLPDDFQLIHVTGQGKGSNLTKSNYQQKEFLAENYYEYLKTADLVISRAGLSTQLELSYLAKPAIIIPLPNSHQTDNAAYFAEKNSCLYLNQTDLDSEKLLKEIQNLFNDQEKLKMLSTNINKIVGHNGRTIITDSLLKSAERY